MFFHFAYFLTNSPLHPSQSPQVDPPFSLRKTGHFFMSYPLDLASLYSNSYRLFLNTRPRPPPTVGPIFQMIKFVFSLQCSPLSPVINCLPFPVLRTFTLPLPSCTVPCFSCHPISNFFFFFFYFSSIILKIFPLVLLMALNAVPSSCSELFFQISAHGPLLRLNFFFFFCTTPFPSAWESPFDCSTHHFPFAPSFRVPFSFRSTSLVYGCFPGNPCYNCRRQYSSFHDLFPTQNLYTLSSVTFRFSMCSTFPSSFYRLHCLLQVFPPYTFLFVKPSFLDPFFFQQVFKLLTHSPSRSLYHLHAKPFKGLFPFDGLFSLRFLSFPPDQ